MSGKFSEMFVFEETFAMQSNIPKKSMTSQGKIVFLKK